MHTVLIVKQLTIQRTSPPSLVFLNHFFLNFRIILSHSLKKRKQTTGVLVELHLNLAITLKKSNTFLIRHLPFSGLHVSTDSDLPLLSSDVPS